MFIKYPRGPSFPSYDAKWNLWFSGSLGEHRRVPQGIQTPGFSEAPFTGWMGSTSHPKGTSGKSPACFKAGCRVSI